MRTVQCVVLCAVVASGAFIADAALCVVERPDGIAVLKDGEVLVERTEISLGGDGILGQVKKSSAILPDGTKVWNFWCEEPLRKFRFEAAERADGAVELSLGGDVAAGSPYDRRILRIRVPVALLDGAAYEGLQGDGRAWRPTQGAFGAAFGPQAMRWLAAAGVTWDFNPIGAGDFCSQWMEGAVNGVWRIVRNGMAYDFSGGLTIRNPAGDYSGTKVVLREGTFADYDRLHFLRSYRYHLPLSSTRAFAFGAPKHGEAYADGNVVFDAARGCGWVGAVPRATVGHPSGAYYTHVGGDARTVYRFAGLPDGHYVFTVQVGNWSGEDNRFSVDVNGVSMGENLSVPAKKARTLIRAVHVTGGTADVAFDGRWIVSALGMQPLLGDGEDFSVRRGFWLTEGYEPASLYRSADYRRKTEFPLIDETIDMPPPGEEEAGAFREVPRETLLPDSASPATQWMRNMRTCKFLSNLSTLAQFDEPGSFAEFMDRQYAGKDFNAYIVSGLHSRHTYPKHVARGFRAICSMAAELHRRGAKLIDHHDVTLLWNSDSGFRVMMGRLGETVRSLRDNLPAAYLCINNPELKRKEYAYDRALAKGGVDGFQLDEVGTPGFGCGCKACREAFHADTGWWIPLDETHPALADGATTRLAKRISAWRVRRQTDWFIGLRRALWDVNPAICLSTYTVHWVQLASVPGRRLCADLFDQARTFSTFGTEVLSRCIIAAARPEVPLRRMNNVFALAYGVPVWGWYYNSDWQGNYFAWCLGNMLGQSSLLTDDLPASAKGGPDFGRWGSSGANMHREGAEPVAAVALLFSCQSRDWNAPNCPFAGELFGMAQELEALHVDYEFINERLLTGSRLAKYKVLVLAASNCLSDGQIAEIRAFAARGGTVVLSGCAGLFDEIGERRPAWPFADVLGRSAQEAPLMAEAAERTVCDVRPVGRGRIVAFPKLYAARFCAPEINANEIWRFSPDPAAEEDFRRHLSDVIGTSSDWLPVRIPETVYTSLWREKDGTLVVHFLNGSGARMKTGEKAVERSPDPAFPPLSDDLEFVVSAPAESRAIATSPDFPGERELAVSWRDGKLSVVLPKDLVRAYAVVKIGARPHDETRQGKCK